MSISRIKIFGKFLVPRIYITKRNYFSIRELRQQDNLNGGSRNILQMWQDFKDLGKENKSNSNNNNNERKDLIDNIHKTTSYICAFGGTILGLGLAFNELSDRRGNVILKSMYILACGGIGFIAGFGIGVYSPIIIIGVISAVVLSCVLKISRH